MKPETVAFAFATVWGMATLAAQPSEALEAIGKAAPSQSGSWRERYELGAGDVINIAFYGRAELNRSGVRIAPDGTLSYLQVASLFVAGRTLEEAKALLETEILRHYRNVRLILTPQELVSKRYVILGEVIDKGVFTLERPITLLEAIARSRGMNTGLFESTTVETADLSHSFLIRAGSRMPIDFEALYHEGDLAHNIHIEPGDYIYIASGLTNSVYVLGAVEQPGTQGSHVKMSVIAAISRRGGFTARAWQSRVLLIRGRLNDPETFIIDVEDILTGEASDVILEPGDILYVSERPWARIEDVFDSALMAFVQSATSSWVTSNVPDLITTPVVPNTGWKNN